MPVKVLRCAFVKNHPNANSLNIYQFIDHKNHIEGDELLQVIANHTNIYREGDDVFVALEGTVLKDGLKIKATKIRGEKSFGMALGKVPGPGEDCSYLFCEPEVKLVPSGLHPEGGQVLITAGNDAAPRSGGAVTITSPIGPTGPGPRSGGTTGTQPFIPSKGLSNIPGPTGLQGRDYSKKIEELTGPVINYTLTKDKLINEIRASDVPRGLDSDDLIKEGPK